MRDGSTRLVGLIGWPVAHSLSPAMHAAAFAEFGLNWRYIPLPVRPGGAAEAPRALKVLGFVGANVTVPHKTTIIEGLDALSDEARAIGAVNTVVIAEAPDGTQTAHGHNTDAEGFVDSLRRAEMLPAGERAVVVGAGGAARAVVLALLREGASEIVVLSRRIDEARRLADRFGAPVRARPFEREALVDAARGATLMVNATPVGMAPREAESIWPDGVRVPSGLAVVDLVYTPRDTRLLRQARGSGALALGGLEMLIAQGAASFALWTGKRPSLATMRRACDAALGGGIR